MGTVGGGGNTWAVVGLEVTAWYFCVCRGDEQSVPQVEFGAEAPGQLGLAMDFLPLEGSKVNTSGVKSR